MTLGQRIHELRTAAGLSQEQLAERLNVSRQAISKWELDTSAPDLDRLVLLGDLFGVSLDPAWRSRPLRAGYPPAGRGKPAPPADHRSGGGGQPRRPAGLRGLWLSLRPAERGPQHPVHALPLYGGGGVRIRAGLLPAAAAAGRRRLRSGLRRAAGPPVEKAESMIRAKKAAPEGAAFSMFGSQEVRSITPAKLNHPRVSRQAPASESRSSQSVPFVYSGAST